MKRFLERRFECKGTLTASPAPFSVGLQGGTEKLTILFVNLLKQQFVKTTVEGKGGGWWRKNIINNVLEKGANPGVQLLSNS